ncbi:MAG: hypothetical protein P1U84_05030 [Parvibaculaceae bacterium]|nr:hypothetical protein [Parvibaculaceae bacterium]
MTETFEVIRWDEKRDFHEAIDCNGRTHYIDFIIEGTMPDAISNDPQLLVGYLVEVDGLFPYVEVAYQPRVVGTTLAARAKGEEA